MAEAQHSAGAAHDSQADRELTINLRPYGWSMWEFEGTRAQLEAEGVMPAGMEWPASGTRWVQWKAGPLKFCLSRTRPPGLKGPARLWWGGDWWNLRCEKINSPDPLQQRVIDARRTLELEAYRASPAGQRAWDEQWRRRVAAECDLAFQAFKALVPGLIPPKRGRKPRQAAA